MRHIMERIHIQRVLNYIEEHLKEELDNTMLAQIAGYSEFHFLRIFRKNIGLTPADYIRKRRISEIVCRISDERPISEIAFEYGFNSKENFTRAFKKEHNILPTEFKAVNCSLRLFQPYSFDTAEPLPTVYMRYLESFTLVAYPFDDEELPPNCWNKYNAEKRSLRLSGSEETEDFGAMIWDPEKERLRYYIGVRSEAARGDLSNTVRLDIAGGLYAVFETPPVTQHEFVATIRRTWDWIYREWLPNSGKVRANGFELESYVESSREYTERIYIPLGNGAENG